MEEGFAVPVFPLDPVYRNVWYPPSSSPSHLHLHGYDFHRKTTATNHISSTEPRARPISFSPWHTRRLHLHTGHASRPFTSTRLLHYFGPSHSSIARFITVRRAPHLHSPFTYRVCCDYNQRRTTAEHAGCPHCSHSRTGAALDCRSACLHPHYSSAVTPMMMLLMVAA